MDDTDISRYGLAIGRTAYPRTVYNCLVVFRRSVEARFVQKYHRPPLLEEASLIAEAVAAEGRRRLAELALSTAADPGLAMRWTELAAKAGAARTQHLDELGLATAESRRATKRTLPTESASGIQWEEWLDDEVA